jgi:SAM-dependent methyltransferase
MEQPSASLSRTAEKFERRYVHPKPGRTLIVGSAIESDKEDRRSRYADVLGVDMREGAGVDRVLDLENELPDDLGKFDHVECLSVLEHSRRPWNLARNLERLMEPGATMFLLVPFVWRFHSYPNDLWRFTHEGVKELFPGIRWESLMYASDKLRPDHYLRAVELQHVYLPKTEVAGFGIRR